ncbi:MAG: hypothetical protein LBF49_00275 [Puniceicoccales bacterium]|jgi:hypothetical protein|nr:hypothetical protein [Puniceicoccales bacterium]
MKSSATTSMGGIMPKITIKGEHAHDLEKLKGLLASNARAFCTKLFPNGKCVGKEYVVGSLGGEPGKSLKICLTGEKTGLWKDFATGESGNNLLDLLHKVRGGNFHDACLAVSKWLRHQENFYEFGDTKTAKREVFMPAGRDKKPKHHPFNDLQKGNNCDILQLSRTLEIDMDGLKLAQEDGILKFFDHPVNGRCWTVVDKNHYVRQDRRLDGKPFIFKDGSTGKGRTIGSPSWPIGIPTDKPLIMLMEGSSDILAAYSIISKDGKEKHVSPVAILGAFNSIHPNALQYFTDKFALLLPDNDYAGLSGMHRWAEQLDGIVAVNVVYDYSKLLRDDGKPVKDLRDFLRVKRDQLGGEKIKSPLVSFILCLKNISEE